MQGRAAACAADAGPPVGLTETVYDHTGYSAQIIPWNVTFYSALLPWLVV